MANKRVHDAEYHKSYYEANRERILARKKAYAERLGEELLAKKRKQYRDSREHILTQKRVYRQTNKGNIAFLNAARKKAVRLRTPAWLTGEDKAYIRAYYSLAAMRTKYSGESWHVDHKIPLQGDCVSGLHVPSNLQVIRAFDNISKKNKFEVVQ